MSTGSLISALHFDAKFNLFRAIFTILKMHAKLQNFQNTIVADTFVTLGSVWIK